jgi:hypothetical protein
MAFAVLDANGSASDVGYVLAAGRARHTLPPPEDGDL